MLNKLAKQVYENAVEKGWYDNGAATNMGERLALIHSEVSEALEADREGRYATNPMDDWDALDDENFKNDYKNNIKGTFEEEMADIIIRVMDMGAFKKIDIERHVWAKMRYNKLRPHKHGGKNY